MNFEYTHPEGSPTDPFEVAVIDAGYKWVRTNSIAVTRPGEFNPNLPIDRLNPHKHSGHNTHLIVEGDLHFDIEEKSYKETKSKTKMKPPRIKTANLDAADPDARKEFYVISEHRYKATSRSGCSFVEGHQLLSPSTAERFMARDTLRAVPPPGGEADWPSQDKIRALLRTARWYPRGVTGVDNTLKPELKWEEEGKKPDVEGGKEGRKLRSAKRRPNPAAPATARVKEALATWFEEEWKDRNRDSHREPHRVRYTDLYHYADGHGQDDDDDDSMKSEDVRDVNLEEEQGRTGKQ